MTWNEVDLERRVWTMEAGRTKQRREFSVPITSEMSKIVNWASTIRCSQFVIT